MEKFSSKSTRLVLFGFVVIVAMVRIEAAPRGSTAAAQSEANRVAVNSDDIGGVVTSSKGPEAGVWVIAETTDLPTKFRKIVVTDDAGRYLLPELPKATYKVWVRGYGLVDSKPVEATPGKTLALTAVIAPNARAAAQYYPGDYWYSLLKLPPKSAFPMKVRSSGDIKIVRAYGETGEKGENSSGNYGAIQGTEVESQAQWAFLLKRGCEVCHQMGNKATRELEPELGTFDSPALAWERRLMSGQVGPQMTNLLNNFGHERGLAMFADWSNRIAAGEIPPAPPRPQGIERNVVITLWDFGTDRSFVHDAISTDERNPTENAYGPIYGPDFSAGAIAVLDPIKNTRSMLNVPLRNENDRKLLRPYTPQNVAAPSPYWGNEIVWNDPLTPSSPKIDSKGRLWVSGQTRANQPDYCREGSNNPFAKNFPMPAASVGKGRVNYDPKTGKFEMVDTCWSGGHAAFANDKDETLYYDNSAGFRGGTMGGSAGLRRVCGTRRMTQRNPWVGVPPFWIITGMGRSGLIRGRMSRPIRNSIGRLAEPVGTESLSIRWTAAFGMRRALPRRRQKFPGKSSAWCPAQTHRKHARRKPTSHRSIIPNFRAWKLIPL